MGIQNLWKNLKEYEKEIYTKNLSNLRIGIDLSRSHHFHRFTGVQRHTRDIWRKINNGSYGSDALLKKVCNRNCRRWAGLIFIADGLMRCYQYK